MPGSYHSFNVSLTFYKRDKWRWGVMGMGYGWHTQPESKGRRGALWRSPKNTTQLCAAVRPRQQGRSNQSFEAEHILSFQWKPVTTQGWLSEGPFKIHHWVCPRKQLKFWFAVFKHIRNQEMGNRRHISFSTASPNVRLLNPFHVLMNTKVLFPSWTCLQNYRLTNAVACFVFLPAYLLYVYLYIHTTLKFWSFSFYSCIVVSSDPLDLTHYYIIFF